MIKIGDIKKIDLDYIYLTKKQIEKYEKELFGAFGIPKELLNNTESNYYTSKINKEIFEQMAKELFKI